MTAVPALPSTWVVGKARASDMELMRLVSAYLLAPPIFKGRQTSAQTLSNGTYTPITWDTEDVDSVGGHDTATNISRYTAVYPGWYHLCGGVSFSSNATGYRQAVWGVNGSLILDYFTNAVTITTGAVTVVAARGELVYLNAGDYVELHGWQNSTISLPTAVASGLQSSMIVEWRSN